jgi:FKBP-type peptidyl-prolyl cis-trans isomerase
MKKLTVLLAVACLAGSVQAQQKNPAKLDKKDMHPAMELKNAVDSASYAYGVVLGHSLKRQMNVELNRDAVLHALLAVMNGDSVVFEAETANKIYGDYNRTMQAKAAERGKAEGEKFLAENKKRKEVTTTASGLQYEVIQRGTGAVMPKETDKVKVHYHGTNVDGSVFDSSVERGQPASFGLNQVIKGWTEGLQLMKVGDKFRFYIPSNLAYGERSPSPKIKPNAVLVFDVELLEINPQQ